MIKSRWNKAKLVQKNRMKILVTSQHYWPETFQITEIAESLAARGHEVTVLTGLPNYPKGVIPDEYLHGKNRHQVHNGVTVERCFLIPRGKNTLSLAVNYYSFSHFATKLARNLPEDFDVVFANQTSPVLMTKPGIEYAKIHNVPLVIYCCDLWPESMKVILNNNFPQLFNHYKKVSYNLYSKATVIAVQSPAFIDYFEQVHGLPREMFHYIPHFSTGVAQVAKYTEHEGVNFLVAGNIGRAQDMQTLLEAVKNMKHKSGFKLHIVGEGPCLQTSIDYVSEAGIDDRVIFYGRKPNNEMSNFNNMADAFILTLDGSSWVGTTIPSRLQGYMSAGKPVLAAINGGARMVIEESACGAAVDAGNSAGLSHLMDDFMDNPAAYATCGKNGREYYEKEFSKDKCICDIENLLINLVKGAS